MVKTSSKMDEGTFRSTPTTHPMERKKRLMDADEQNSSILINHNEYRGLISGGRRSSSSRQLPRTNSHSKRQYKLKGAAERKLRTVRRAWGSFKSRVNPNPRRKASGLWAATLASPQTPTTRQHLINSPLTPGTLRNSRFNTEENHKWMTYRDFHKVTLTPSSPRSPYSKARRRSARIAGKQRTPGRPGSPQNPQDSVTSSCSPYGEPDSPPVNNSGMSLDASAVFREVINRMEALNDGLEMFEKMSSSLTESIKANDSKEEAPDENKPPKTLRRQSSSFLRRSLRLQSS